MGYNGLEIPRMLRSLKKLPYCSKKHVSLSQNPFTISVNRTAQESTTRVSSEPKMYKYGFILIKQIPALSPSKNHFKELLDRGDEGGEAF